MRGFNAIFGLTLLLFFSAQRGIAQGASPTVLTIAGGYAATPDGAVNLSWTAGELFVQTVTVGDRTLTQGFQQNDLFVNAIPSLGPPLAVKVFPNPARDQLTLEFTESLSASLELFTLQGIRLLTKNIRGERASLNLDRLPSALYLLRIADTQGREQCFKIHIVH